jgi:hypothetical protein
VRLKKTEQTGNRAGDRGQFSVSCPLSSPPKRVTLSGSDLLKNNNKQKDISKNRNKNILKYNLPNQ